MYSYHPNSHQPKEFLQDPALSFDTESLPYNDMFYPIHPIQVRAPPYGYQNFAYPVRQCQEIPIPPQISNNSYDTFHTEHMIDELMVNHAGSINISRHYDQPPPYPALLTPPAQLSMHQAQLIQPMPPSPTTPMTPGRAKISTSLWDDEDTLCYQIDVGGICVTRRQDNDMVNGTKLLNVTGMSRGKRDGILKNEKGRVVVKLGAMHLKGVWVTFSRAKHLATHFNILDQLYPLFADDPAIYFLPESLSQSYFNYIECEAFFPRNGYHIEDNKSGMKRDDHKTRPMNNSSEMMNVSMIHNQMPIDYSPVFQVMDNSYHSDCSLTYQSSPHSLYQQDLSPSIPVAPTMIPFQTPMYNYKQLPTTPQYEHLYGNV